MTPIQSNKTVFFNRDGEPLNGTIYIGQPSTDPRTNPKTVTFRDAGGTTFTASQPLKTISGRVVYNGLPITALVDGEYSLLMLDSVGDQVVYDPSITESGGGDAEGFAELIRVGLTLDAVKEFDVSVGESVRSVGKTLATDGLGADWLAVSNTGNPADDVDLIDFANGLQGRRNESFLYNSDIDDLQWLGTPVGGYLILQTNLSGVSEPPTDSERFRYVKLTAGLTGSYNSGVLTDESVTGSAPLVLATAKISFGPLTGQTIRLINTENRYLMPGTSAGTFANDQMQQITGSAELPNYDEYTSEAFRNASGALEDGGNTGSTNLNDASSITGSLRRLEFDSSASARTGDHTNVKHIQATAYMRIQ